MKIEEIALRKKGLGSVSDSKDVSIRLKDILQANTGDGRGSILGNLNPGFMFQVNSGDEGFKKDFKDPWESSRRQVGHFLTAVNLASWNDEVAVGLIIGHEKKPDGNPKQLIEAFADRNEVKAFRDAMKMIDEDKGSLKRAMLYIESKIKIDRKNEGNSYQDLKLSLAGYWMGKAIQEGKFKNGQEVLNWMRRELQE